MSNIYDYLDKYGNKTFEEVGYTEVDNIIFTQISYINFSNIVSKDFDKINLEDAANMFFNEGRKCFLKKASNLLKVIKDKPRYKNLLLSNYIYKLTDDEQFGALTIDINNDLRCVIFEGTDNTIVGWKEDFSIAYLPIIPSVKDATKYLKQVSKKAKNIIITGHSKGGYIALESVMNSNIFIKRKVRKIYSLDGPGVKKEEFYSKKFNSIKNKYVKIIPKCSIIGNLLYDIDNPIVCNAKAVGLIGHSVFYWTVDNNKLKRDTLTKYSIDLDNYFTAWLESYSSIDIEYFSDYIFNMFDKYNIVLTRDIITINKKNYIHIINDIKNSDPKFKKMLKEFLYYIKNYYLTDIKNNIPIISTIYDKLVKNEI